MYHEQGHRQPWLVSIDRYRQDLFFAVYVTGLFNPQSWLTTWKSVWEGRAQDFLHLSVSSCPHRGVCLCSYWPFGTGCSCQWRRGKRRSCFHVYWKCPGTTVVSAIPPSTPKGQAISEAQKKNTDLRSYLWHGNNQTAPLAAEKLSFVDPKIPKPSLGFLHWLSVGVDWPDVINYLFSGSQESSPNSQVSSDEEGLLWNIYVFARCVVSMRVIIYNSHLGYGIFLVITKNVMQSAVNTNNNRSKSTDQY